MPTPQHATSFCCKGHRDSALGALHLQSQLSIRVRTRLARGAQHALPNSSPTLDTAFVSLRPKMPRVALEPWSPLQRTAQTFNPGGCMFQNEGRAPATGIVENGGASLWERRCRTWASAMRNAVEWVAPSAHRRRGSLNCSFPN